MNPEIKKRAKRTAILCAMALVVGGLVGYMQIQNERGGQMKKTSAPMEVAGADIGGPYTLVDQTGKAVTEKDYAGLYKLMYFGFTYCPAICPTELQKITKVMKQVEAVRPDYAKDIQPLFITVDPERDTVDVMREYVKLFDKRLVGLTGTQAQIDDVKKKYRIYSAKVQSENSTDYTVDHSSFIYFLGPDDSLLGIYRAADDADLITADVIKITEERGL